MKKVQLLFAAICFAGSVNAQVADSAKRKVELKGAVNFRDLGGYATADGHHVKWGKVYRSADMSKLTDQDLTVLSSRKIAYEESKKAPDRLNPNTDYILCPAGSDSVGNMMQSFKGKTSGDSVMEAYYSNTKYLADRYKPFFGKLLNLPADKGLVFHCSAGKDRTGIGAALLLYSLGVPYNTIVNDYEASNYYRAAENEKMVKSMVKYMQINEGVAKDVLSVKKQYLEATFTAIKQQYGSVDKYLKTQIGLSDADIKSLKKKFLE
jgi:protein-tyrosine phosphatase